MCEMSKIIKSVAFLACFVCSVSLRWKVERTSPHCDYSNLFKNLEAVSNNKDGSEGHKNKRSSETIAAGDDKDSMRNKWKSGYVIVNDRKNDRLRNDPWWMREEEKNNPRMLPEYMPFWRINRQKIVIDESLKKEELVLLAKERGLSTTGKKSEILSRIKSYDLRFSLTDDNFVAPKYRTAATRNDLPPCYPEAYEGLLGIEMLREKIKLITAPNK